MTEEILNKQKKINHEELEVYKLQRSFNEKFFDERIADLVRQRDNAETDEMSEEMQTKIDEQENQKEKKLNALDEAINLKSQYQEYLETVTPDE